MTVIRELLLDWCVDLNSDVTRLMSVSALYWSALYSVLAQQSGHQVHGLVGVPEHKQSTMLQR